MSKLNRRCVCLLAKTLTLSLDQQILLDKLVLLENLHCVRHSRGLVAAQVNFAEGATTHHRQQLEVVNRNLGSRLKNILRVAVVIFVLVVVLLVGLIDPHHIAETFAVPRSRYSAWQITLFCFLTFHVGI